MFEAKLPQCHGRIFRFAMSLPLVLGHNASTLIKKILLFCFLIWQAPFVDGEEIALSCETLAIMQASLSDYYAKKYDASIAKLKEADKIEPGNPLILNLIGATYAKKKEFAAAKLFYDRALAEKSDFFPAQFNLGELIFLEARYSEALGYFRHLLQANPNRRDLIQFKIFLCEIQIGDTKGAEKTMKKFGVPIASPAWYFASAIWEAKMGNKHKARELVEGARFIFGQKTTIFEDSFQDVGLDLR